MNETRGFTIAKATPEDFESVLNLLTPMEKLFNHRWSNPEDWTSWDDDGSDKIELLSIRKEIAEEEHYCEDDVDNRLVIYELIKRRMNACSCSEWRRVIAAAEALIATFCDPHEDYLAYSPELARAAEDMILGE